MQYRWTYYGLYATAASIVDDGDHARCASLHGSSSGIFGYGVTKIDIERF